MSSLSLLVTELQSLASETRRKHPDVREAAEKSIAILKSTSDQGALHLAEDGSQSEDLLRPVFMGCATKNSKVTSIALGSLQRLIALRAVPQSAVQNIINTMNDCMTQGVDIQLRILQTLLSLITNFTSIHGPLLGDALLLCFKMQESRIAVVSSTAAATLRQLVMFVIDKVVDEDRRDDVNPSDYTEIVLPDGTHKTLRPSALDAYAVVEDLCLLANTEKPHFLKLGSLPKTFALELIESVLTNYHVLFRQHTELVVLLQHHLCPLLLRLMSEKPLFPLTLRSIRVVFLLLKQFSEELPTEGEVFLSLLVKVISGEADSHSSEGFTRPQWMRVLSMEIIRGLCSDADLMRRVWENYDSKEGSSNLFGSLVSVLKRLVTEKPALLGVSSQMFGVGVSSHHSEPGAASGSSGYGFDVGTVAGLVANAASATVTGVVGMMGSEHGLSLASSSMKLQCIDQLDKADAPPIPESYIYLLGLQCLVSISEGFAASTVPVFNAVVVQRQRAAGETTIKAPPALDVASLPPEEASTRQVKAVYGMLENGWPALLAALSFLIATNLSDELFGDVLQAYQNLTNVAGMLGLTTPRDAFLTSLAKFSIPARVVASIDAVEPATPKSAFQEGFNALAGSTPPQPPGLSERNMACLKVLVSCALFLAGSLGPAWYQIFETLQNADYVLSVRSQKTGGVALKKSATGGPTTAAASGNRSVSSSSSPMPGQDAGLSQQRHALLNDIDGDNVLRSIQRLFDSSKNLDDSAFQDFVTALCRLGAEMVEMQSGEEHGAVEVEASESTTTLTPAPYEPAHRRRASGIHLSRTLRTGDFSINKLGTISRQNILRFTSRPPNVAWTVVMGHLVSVLRNKAAPHALRLQAAHTLDDILIVVPRNIGSSEERRRTVQQLMLDVLAEQVAPDPHTGNTITVVEIRKMGLETLHQILQSAGHTLLVGWETIFSMLGGVCESSPNAVASAVQSATASPITSPRPKRPLSLYAVPQDRAGAVLVRIAFQSLTLVCDSLSTLSPEHLRLCISTIGRFGSQADTNIALTAAGSLLWGVSDSIQTRRKESEQEQEYNALWMLLLLEVLGLCTDSRSEVRVGAIQTLFRTLQLYGSTLSLETWDECIWKVIFPLLDSITEIMGQIPRTALATGESATSLGLVPDTGQAWDESKSLTLQSIGSIFSDFLTSKLIHLESFERIWDSFVGHIQTSFAVDYGSSCTAALRCLEKALNAANKEPHNTSDRAHDIWLRVWKACDEMGQLVQRRVRPPLTSADNGSLGSSTFDQESLLALVNVIQSTRSLSRKKEGQEWDLEQLSRLMAILKAIVTYPDSPNYKPDTDALTLVQSAVIETIDFVDVSVPLAPSLIMRDLSELLTLPYIGAFDVPIPSAPSDATPPARDTRSSKRVTYIGLTKAVMPMLLNLFLRFKDDAQIYSDATLETVFAAYSVPVKLKYECPEPSKHGKDEPLWKTATTTFIRLLKESTVVLRSSDNGIPNERIEGIWRQIIDVFSGGILADCRIAENMTLEEQEAEELFDLSLIAALEIDVVPYLADGRVPDYVVVQLAKTLYRGSQLYMAEDGGTENSSTSLHSSADSESSTSTKVDETIGSALYSRTLPRERFSYWCFDLLFLICSDALQDEGPLRQRLAALSLPTLLQRCRGVLVSYLADNAIRGNYPFSRVREEELVYVLKKLFALRLWPSSLWAALSDNPSKYCLEQPGTQSDLSVSELFAEARKRSTRAHIIELYGPICRIAALSRKAPLAWTGPFIMARNEDNYKLVKLSFVAENATAEKTEQSDARELALSCLEEIGKELSGQ